MERTNRPFGRSISRIQIPRRIQSFTRQFVSRSSPAVLQFNLIQNRSPHSVIVSAPIILFYRIVPLIAAVVAKLCEKDFDFSSHRRFRKCSLLSRFPTGRRMLSSTCHLGDHVDRHNIQDFPQCIDDSETTRRQP